MVEQFVVGSEYRVAVDMSVSRWCVCDLVLRAGDVVLVRGQPSPNRVLVQVRAGLHVVRRSTLRLCVNEIAASFSGRTPGSGPGDAGSSPAAAANKEETT